MRIEHVAPEQHPGFYASLRFALNVTRSDMVRLGHSPSIRLFEASACATPVISDSWASLDSYFDIGREVLTADTTGEMEKLLTGISPRKAADIGMTARRRVLREHEASFRAELLERCLRGPVSHRTRVPERRMA
jgi:spore maturation protein CgeB